MVFAERLCGVSGGRDRFSGDDGAVTAEYALLFLIVAGFSGAVYLIFNGEWVVEAITALIREAIAAP